MKEEQDGVYGQCQAPPPGGLPALFLDRDGVIVENRDRYVRAWADIEIFPQALAALAHLRHWPGKIVVVTNQSVVGRGLISHAAAREINDRLLQEIERHGGRIDAVYICPHAPSHQCRCRKPQPGLLLQAARDLGLDLRRSFMIGDALTDLRAGRAAGVQHVALLQTGRGLQQQQLPEAAALAPFSVFPTLFDAIRRLLSPQGMAPSNLCGS